MTETFWLWIGTLGMLGGSILLFVLGGTRTREEEGHTVAHGIVPLFAAIAYFAMAAHQGQVTLPSGRVFLYARYVDWSVTTPLLLVGLATTALHGTHRRSWLVAGLLSSDVVMILTGLFFGLSEDPFAKWVWFVTSCVACVAVVYILLLPLLDEAALRDEARNRAYRANLPILGILWVAYPVVVFLGPDGVGVWGATLATASVTILDLVAKVGYGILATRASRIIADADLARPVAPVTVPTPAVPNGRPAPGGSPGD